MQIDHVKHFPWVIQLYQPGDDHHLEQQHTITTGSNSEREQFPRNSVHPGSCRMHRALQFEAVAAALPWCQAMAVLMAPEQSFPCSLGFCTELERCWSTRYSYLYKQVILKYSENRRNNFYF